MEAILACLESSKIWVIDRFESSDSQVFAVVENPDTLETQSISIRYLPPGASPGDSLEVEGGQLKINNHHTLDRKNRINSLMAKIKAKNN